MATRIKLKRSLTPNSAPTISDLADKEVALNIVDRTLFVNNNGTIEEVANADPNDETIVPSMFSSSITEGVGNTWYVSTNGTDKATLGSVNPRHGSTTGSNAWGKTQSTSFASLKYCLDNYAQSGDIIIIASGTYTETFPLTVPDGVAIKGAGLKSTFIQPSVATNDLDAFLIEGNCNIEDLCVKDFYYDNVNDTGYAFKLKSGYSVDVDGRRPYIQRCSVITKGSTVTLSDPRGYASGDAGRGALVDGSIVNTNSAEAALLFNECTFVVPNSVGLYLKNGARCEWLNSFTYFASDSIKGENPGGSGFAGQGRTRLKLNNITGTFATGNTVSLYDTDGITVLASGTINENDGTYIYISGQGSGEFTEAAADITGKPVTVNGDAQLDTSRKQLGSASLLLDGSGDYLTLNGSSDFGFGTGDFTLEGFAYLDNTASAQILFDFRQSAIVEVSPVVYFNGTSLTYYVNNVAEITSTIAAGNWYHIAVVRSGTSTRMYVNGSQVGSTYNDTNDYGTTKPLVIGANLNGAANLAGSIDEVRISKGVARYTGASFTVPTAEFTADVNTSLLLHFNGLDGSTDIFDGGITSQDIRSSGGGTASFITLADYTDFGAELRSIGSASVYGERGISALGKGVRLRCIVHNFGYVGVGADQSNDISNVNQANEIIETGGGRALFTSMDQNGDFRVGNAFFVDQERGTVSFASDGDGGTVFDSITVTSFGNTTTILPTEITTGNLKFFGNTIATNSGNLILDPDATADIVLNAETIIPETLYFTTNKLAGFSSEYEGGVSFQVNGYDESGYSSYGLYSNKNLTVYNSGIDSVTIVNEGSEYSAGQFTVDAVTSPSQVATATTSLDLDNGSIKELNIVNKGSLYTQIPSIQIGASENGTTAIALGSLEQYGSIVELSVSLGGSGYTSPTVVFNGNYIVNFSTAQNVSTSEDTITITGHYFDDGNEVIYDQGLGTSNIGLINGNTYFIVNSTEDTIQLSNTLGGPPVSLTASTALESHTLTAKPAQATLSVTGGVIDNITLTYPGIKYNNASVNIIDSTGQGALITAVVGKSLATIQISDSGDGYVSTPSVSVIPNSNDLYGSGAVVTSVLGFPLNPIILNNFGLGYSKEPIVVFSGGNPDEEPVVTSIFDKRTGRLTSIEFVDEQNGVNYTSSPSISIVGGSGKDVQLNLSIAPFEATITSGGSGYTPGVYQAVQFTGGSPESAATATITVVGLVGTITTPGSGYSNGTYQNTTLYNEPTAVYTVTIQSKVALPFTYDAGGNFNIGDTITGSTSGASGVVTYVGNNFVRFDSVANGPFQGSEIISNGSITATTSSSSTPIDAILINGSESPTLSLSSHNTYRFDVSSVNAFNFNNFSNTDAQTIASGNFGQANAFVDLVVFDTATIQSNVYEYGSSLAGGKINVIDGSGSQGNYGVGGIATLTVTSGQVSNLVFTDQGRKYKSTDTLIINQLGGSGSGFLYTITNNDTSISQVTDISTSGGPYVVSNILSVDPTFDGDGDGSGFQYTVNKVGILSEVEITDPGYNYKNGEILYLISDQFVTDGTPIELSVNTIIDTIPFEASYDGSVTSINWSIDADGNATLSDTVVQVLQASSIVNGTSISTTSLNASGAVSANSLLVATSTSTNSFTAATAQISSTLSLGTRLTASASTGNLTTSGVIKSTTGGFNSNDDLLIINSTISTTIGNQLILDPANGQTVKVDATTALVVPVGNTANRPATPESGSIRFNSEISQFEGYDGNNEEWVSVGGVKDVDGNTYIAAESSPGANENILYFYNDDINTLNVTTSSIDLEAVNVLNANNLSGLEINGNVNIKDDLTFDTISEGRILLDDGTVLVPALSFVDQERTGLVLTDNQTAISVTSISGQIAEFGSTELSIFRNTTFNKLEINDTSFTAGSGYDQGQYNATSFEGGTGDGLVADITIAFEVNISTAGVGYDVATYENIPLNTTSGTGSGAIANITVDGTTGVAEVVIIDAGNGQYQIGDTLSTAYTNMQYDDGTGNLIITTEPTTNFEFIVTSVGAITVLNITDNGEGYRDLDVLTVPTSVIGSSTGFELTILQTSTTEEVNINKDDGSITSKSLVVSTSTGIDVNGDLSITNSSISRTTAGNLQLTTQSGSYVEVTGIGALLLPAGTTGERPPLTAGDAGAIRYNTSESRFEGFNGSFFVSLGGVRDVDGNTYISAELNPGDNDNILRFVNDDVQSMQVEQNKITLQSIVTLHVTDLVGVTEWEAGASATAPADPIGDPPVLVYFAENVYSVDSTGTFDEDPLNYPIHTTGTVANGTVDLTWVRTIYQDLNYTGKDLNLQLEELNLNASTLKLSGDTNSAYIGSNSQELNVAFGLTNDEFIKILSDGSISINNGFGSSTNFIEIIDKNLRRFDLKDTRIFSNVATLDTSSNNAVNIAAFPYSQSYSGKFMIEIEDDSATPRRQYSEISYLVKSDGSDILYTENNKLYTDVELCEVSIGIDESNNITIDIVDLTSSTTTVFSVKVVSQTILA